MHSEGYCSLSVCVCVCMFVRPSTVFLGNRGSSEHETWTYYQVVGMHGKDSGAEKAGERMSAEVSVRLIEIPDDHCT